jgi:integrase
LTLRIDQIDVKHQIVRLSDTKNGSERTVPVSVRAAQLLALALANPLRPADCDLVFFGDVGKTGLQAPCRIDKLFDACRREANIVDFRLHDFRHEATSRLVEKGTLSDIDVASINGHKSMQMLRRYAHLRAENLVGLLK